MRLPPYLPITIPRFPYPTFFRFPLVRFLASDPPRVLRNAFALTMCRAWYVPFYFYGVIHGDPHLGNYTVRDDGAVNLLDFGCIRIFPASFIQGVIDLYREIGRAHV